MPRKERLKKQREKELREAATGSGSLTSWLKKTTTGEESSRSDEQVQAEAGVSAGGTESVEETANEDDDMEEVDSEEESAESVQDIENPKTENIQKKGGCEEQQGEAVCESESQDTAQEDAKDSEVSFQNILHLQYPTDPAHVLKFNLKYDEAFIKVCTNIGPCQPVFPAFPKNEEGRSKIYGTLPVSTATVERSFSKLKLIKTTLRSLCHEERLSDLLLLSIEKDIPIEHSVVIDIYKNMANRKLLL